MPGTISGAENPDDRLKTERPSGGYAQTPRPGVPATPPAVDEPSPSLSGAVFLLAVLIAGFVLLRFATLPMMELVGQIIQAFGVPSAAPSSYATGYLKATRSVPQVFLVSTISGQLVMLLLAVAGALILGGGVRARLGFVRPRGGWRVLALAVAIEVLTIVLGLALLATFIPAGTQAPAAMAELDAMLKAAPLPMWIALILSMSLLPGLCEESLFRGLIQRRLLEGWRPVVALLLTGAIFTLLHPPFFRALALLPGTLWYGYIAWRCGSILPGILLHALSNASVQGFDRLFPSTQTTWSPTALERGVAGGIALVSGLLAVWLLVLIYRWTKVEPEADASRILSAASE